MDSRRSFLRMAMALTLWAGPIVAQATNFDPIENMCVRYDHQSTLKNNQLYIDGGTQTFVPVVDGVQQTVNITIGYNSVVIKIDMSQSWDWKTNISETFINKKGLANVESTPVLSRGALYGGTTDDDNIYLYGGTTSYINTSNPAWEPPTSAQYSLFSYNTVSGGVSQFNISGASPERPSSGASATAPDQGLAFYIEGQIDSGSCTETQVFGDSKKVNLNGMIVIDTKARTARNLSTALVADGSPRTYGSLQYIPGVGEKGILVHLGGSDSNGNLLSLSSVDIFNVNSLDDDTVGTWMSQDTAGDVPVARISACVVMGSAQDNSSHNIYMYGGRGAGNVFFDQVYVLSIPTFTWIKLYEGTSPRFAHTCHLVANRQMVTVGGITNNPLGSGPCDYQTKGVNIFDLSALQWGSVYDANAPPFAVPSQISAKIGGSDTGGSNILYPAALKQLFSPNTTSSVNLPNSNPHISGGAIAGAAIGSLLGTALVCAGLWLLHSRWRRNNIVTEERPIPPEKDIKFVAGNRELDGRGQRVEMPSEFPYAEVEAFRGVEIYQPPAELPWRT